MKRALLIVLLFITNLLLSQTHTTNFHHLSYNELKRQYFEVVKTEKEKKQLTELYIKKETM